MDCAREKLSGLRVEAESLWYLENIHHDGYECPDCAVPVYPASYDKEINKKRPYFHLGKGKLHAQGCYIVGETEIIRRAANERVGTTEGFPLPVPNKLVLRDTLIITSPTECEVPLANIHGSRTRSDAGRRSNTSHAYTVTTIRPLCRTFMNYPHDLAYLPINIPGCTGNTYAEVFFRLPSNKVEKFQRSVNLYYAPLQWGKPQECKSHIEWNVNAGEWDTTANRRSNTHCYKVRLMWGSWTDRQRSVVKKEIDVCRKEVQGTKKKAWLFCIGVQGVMDASVITVEDYRLVCALVGDVS